MGTTNFAFTGIVNEQLTEENIEYLKVCMKSYFMGQGLWDLVTGKDVKPKESEPYYEAWVMKNARALHAIQISCGADLLEKIRDNESAKVAWDCLAKKGKIPSPSTTSENYSQETLRHHQFSELEGAISKGDLVETKQLIEQKPGAVQERITFLGNTALHIAVLAGHTNIVEELVKRMEKEDLELKNYDRGFTALHYVAINGLIDMAEAILNKNPKLLTIDNNDKLIPVIVAAINGPKHMTQYLYRKTPLEELSSQAGATLLNSLITDRIFDLALDLLKSNPELCVTEDYYQKYTMKLLARKPSIFPSGYHPSFLKKWIYKCIPQPEIHGIHQENRRSDEESLQMPHQGPISHVNSSGLVWKVLKCFVPELENIHSKKSSHFQVLEILSCICKKIPKLRDSEYKNMGVSKTMYDAIENGIIEIVTEAIKYYPEIMWRKGVNGRTIFGHSIALRQEKIFNLVFNSPEKIRIIMRRRDMFRNNSLHLAAKLSPSTRLEFISGAALQMQRELQWFKGVEQLVPPKHLENVNEKNKTPSVMFTEEHQELVKEGERWMKNTAASCMVVATLIAALMFTTAFTVPGGNNQVTGVPLFIGNDAFLIFIISNAMSLFSSTISVLIFLGILTTRYAEKDFHKSLPLKLIIGLFTLFFSIVTMMIAFGSSIDLVIQKRVAWASIAVIVLATAPILLFALLQFPLLLEMLIRTYGRGIIKKPAVYMY